MNVFIEKMNRTLAAQKTPTDVTVDGILLLVDPVSMFRADYLRS